MDRKISDEQLDQIAKNLLQDFTLDDDTLDEIAESPKLWWNVKNRIEAEKTRRERNWFFAFRPQILAFGVLALLVCSGSAFVFLNSKGNSNESLAKENPVQIPSKEKAETSEILANVSPNDNFKSPEISKKLEVNRVSENVPVKTGASKIKVFAKDQTSAVLAKQTDKSPRKKNSPKTANEETKTDFIALSYAGNSDSGQIVRVKVPSSMMVSLGVATNVEKESALVSAEVVIGDDGLARAIRFIR